MRKIILPLAVIVIFAAVVYNAVRGFPTETQTIRVGIVKGPQSEIMAVVKQVAEKDDLIIKLVEYSDYIQPNEALNKGAIDANIFQHQPYLDHVVQDRKYEIVAAAKTIAFPLGLYAKESTSLAVTKPGSSVAIPGDPVNGGRALLLLQKAGLIKLKPQTGPKASTADIADNIYSLSFIEFDATKMQSALATADLATLNINQALAAGLTPGAALACEDADSNYVNIIVVSSGNADSPVVAKLIKAYQSPEVKQFILKRYQGSVLPAW